MRCHAAAVSGGHPMARSTPSFHGVPRATWGQPPMPHAAWKRILRSVRTFTDLEPEFLGRVEELIDFVTVPGSA